MTDGPGAIRSSLTTVGWGVFCACSWTWCIGMYLPRILLDRYGWTGFAVFAVPNVIGCAAFGYALRTRQRSERLVAAHRPAAAWFSVITIAYHMFFAVFLVAEVFTDPIAVADEPGLVAIPALLVMAALFGAGWVISHLGNRAWLALATATFLLSATLFVVVAARPSLLADLEPTRPLRDAAWLAPIFVFGFLLCPYLDLTFHRAAQHAPSRHAFAVFGLTFLVMIVFTCFMWNQGAEVLRWVIMVQLAAQGVFTVGAHLRELRASGLRPAIYRRLLLGVPWMAGLAFLAASLTRPHEELGEATYIRFLVFYGLVFPAYVLVFVGPWRPATHSGRALALFAGAVLLAAPFYEIGFVGERFAALIVPVIAVMAWIAVRLR